MKFKTFKGLIEACKSMHDTAIKKDKAIEEALGGETSVMTVDYFTHIDLILNSISNEFNCTEDTLDWYFWDVVTSECNPEELYFSIDGAKYASTMENIWMDLTGILDERFASEVETEDKEIEQEVQGVQETQDDSEELDDIKDIDIIKYFLKCANVEILDKPNGELQTFEFSLEDKDQLWEDIKEFCYENQVFKIYIEENLNYSGEHFSVKYYAEQEVAK